VPLRVEGLEQDLGTEVLLDVPVSSAAALGDLRVLAAVDEGLVLLEPLDPEPQLLDLDPGLLVGAAELPDGSVLISGSEGLFVLQEGSLVVSPLAALVEPLGPVRLHADGEDLWLAAEEGLYLWREGELLSVLPASLPAGDARLARGPSPDGLAEGTWVASADSVYFLRDEGDGLVAEPVVLGSEVSGLAVDGYGVVWLAIDGALQRRKPDGSWDWL